MRAMRPFSAMLGPLSKQRTKAYHMAAPVGGINTVDVASAMDPKDCLYLFNLIPFQYGLRVRSGWHEHATNVGTSVPVPDLYQDCSPLMFYLASTLGGARIGAWTGLDNPGVRSILSFAGSSDTGQNDRMFACTKEGIWDVSLPGSTPTLMYGTNHATLNTWVEDLTSGRGVGTSFTNIAGEHFYAYCDETNGYLVYRESTQAWEKVLGTPTEAWLPGTAYTAGDRRANGTLGYVATTSGTSTPAWTVGTAYTFGTKVVAQKNTYECTKPGTSVAAWAPFTTYSVADKRANGGNLYEVAAVEGPDQPWLPAHVYEQGDRVINGGNIYTAIQVNPYPSWTTHFEYLVGDRVINSWSFTPPTPPRNVYECIAAPPPARSRGIPPGPYTTSDNIQDGDSPDRFTAGFNPVFWAYVGVASGISATGSGPTGEGGAIVDGTVVWAFTSATTGTSFGWGGPTGTGTAITDGTVVWKYLSLAGPFGTGTTVDGLITATEDTAVVWKYVSPQGPQGGGTDIKDGTVVWNFQPTIGGVDPGSFRSVMSWKNRLWFTIANSATAVYLPIGQYVGVIDANDVLAGGRVNFGSRFRYGGNLVGLWNWTVDGGVGIDDHLVGISSSGDVVIYTGTDPNIPGQFGLKGVWWVGPVPPGRKIASAFGGDLFILSLIGCVPLSKLVAGYMIRDPNIYATAKIGNLFNIFMTERGDLPGWEINMHPTDNLLMIMVPASPGKVQEQLCMSLASKGWSRSVGVPMTTMETWKGRLYFGTADSRVCVNEGYVDGDTLDHAIMWSIDFSLLTSFQSLGSSNKKRIHMVRPFFMTDGTNPGYETQSRWDFDISEVDATPISEDLLERSLWNVGLWDRNKWDDGRDTAGRYYGAAGMGTHVAVILKGSANTLTTFIGFDIAIDQGGIL